MSETSYSHSTEFPIYRTGQGSGHSPIIWRFLSSILFDCYETKAHFALYQNPDRTSQHQWYMIGFVDDTDGQVNQFSADERQDTLETIHRHTQENATTLAQLLGVTGGALELQKCSYHVVAWKFTAHGAPVLASCPPEFQTLEVTDPIYQHSHSLQYLPLKRHIKRSDTIKNQPGHRLNSFDNGTARAMTSIVFNGSLPSRDRNIIVLQHLLFSIHFLFPNMLTLRKASVGKNTTKSNGNYHCPEWV